MLYIFPTICLHNLYVKYSEYGFYTLNAILLHSVYLLTDLLPTFKSNKRKSVDSIDYSFGMTHIGLDIVKYQQ